MDKSAWDCFVDANEIGPDVSSDLVSVLGTTKVVLVLDDSGSMGTTVIDKASPNAAALAAAGMPQATRWSELEKLTATVVDLLNAAPMAEKMDAYFLNRGQQLNVSTVAGIAKHFSRGPNGGTPLCGRLRSIFEKYRATMRSGRRVLVIVITDGEPTDGSVLELYNILEKELNKGPNKDNLYVSFAECNDNEKEMQYLDTWDTKLQHFDNTDDFPLESLRVRRAQQYKGLRQRFTYMDYVIKIILGAVMRKYWNMDQAVAPPDKSGRLKMLEPSTEAPPNKVGEIKKQGRVYLLYPSWKTRRVCLSADHRQSDVPTGVSTKYHGISCISYFDAEQRTLNGIIVGIYAVNVDGNLVHVDGDRRLTLSFKNSPEVERQAWVTALQQHVDWNISNHLIISRECVAQLDECINSVDKIPTRLVLTTQLTGQLAPYVGLSSLSVYSKSGEVVSEAMGIFSVSSGRGNYGTVKCNCLYVTGGAMSFYASYPTTVVIQIPFLDALELQDWKMTLEQHVKWNKIINNVTDYASLHFWKKEKGGWEDPEEGGGD